MQPKTQRRRHSQCLVLTLCLIAGLAVATAPAAATACNTDGCWGALVEMVRVAGDGKIWFVVDDSDRLDILVPADGCIVRSIWMAGSHRALYIRADDPQRDEKYTMLLTAFTTGAPVRFDPISDPATGWCSVNNVEVRL